MTTAEEILAARKANPGKAPAVIAAELGVSRQRVSKVLTDAGISSESLRALRQRPGGAKPFAERSRFGQQLDVLGWSNAKAAKLFKVTEVTITRYATGAIEPPEAVDIVMLVALGLGPEAVAAGHEAGVRKLKKAVDAATAEA